MSDSEDDPLSNNASNNQNGLTSIYVKGPNNSNVNGFSFPNNFLSSTRNTLPYNMQHSRYGAVRYDQRSVYNRREISPMSERQNFYQPFPGQNHRNYARSLYNGRGSSPASVRTIDSTASVSAADIASSFRNMNYSKNEIRLIKEAYNKYFKHRARERIRKRHNLKLFLKNTRRNTGEDSGDLGSDSSLSSDDCRSTRTALYKDNYLRYKVNKNVIKNQQTTIKESNLYKDSTQNLGQSYLRNVLSTDPISNSTVVNTERDKRYPFPAQRFNKSLQPSVDLKSSRTTDRLIVNQDKQMNNLNCGQESEQEEIFSEVIMQGDTRSSKSSRKRCNDLNELHSNPSKKSKNPETQLHNELYKELDSDNNNEIDFVFAKPQLPLKNSAKTKGNTSNQPLTDADQLSDSTALQKNSLSSHISKNQTEINDKFDAEIIDINETMKENQPNNEVSMRPSFIKRKLFTQKLDITESKNLSNTSQCNSPQIKKSANNNKEKNKTRKIVPIQSCLQREVLAEDNIMDLIQKIVPSDGMNVTNATSHSQAFDGNSQVDPNDNCNAMSAISICNTNENSDTYTDEEIFTSVDAAYKIKNNLNKVQTKLDAECRIVLNKLPHNFKTTTKVVNNTSEQKAINGVIKVDAQKKPNVAQKSFWDTDLESDFDNNDSLPRNLNRTRINNVANKIEKSGTSSTTKIGENKKTQRLEVSSIKNQSTPKRKTNVKTTQVHNKKSNSKIPEKGSQMPERRKKDAAETDQNVSKSSNRKLRSESCTRNVKEKKSYPNFGTVTLINHRVQRSKRFDNRHCFQCEMKSLDSSNDPNITVKSLRSWIKKK